MKVFNRGVAAFIAVMMIFSTGTTFAAKPNTNPNATENKVINQGMKSLDKTGLPGDLKDLVKAIKIVDFKALPMDSPNVVRVVGSIEIIDDDFSMDMFKGKTKLKLKFGNVTVNVDKFGDFKQTMPMWKLDGLAVSLYMGHVFLYNLEADLIDDMDDPIPVDRALARAQAAVDKLPSKLTIEHRNLVVKARTAVDMLKAALDAANIKSGTIFNEYKMLLSKVEAAEGKIDELLEDLITWIVTPREVDRNEYSGRLRLNGILPGRIEVLVQFEEAGEDDLELTPNSSGRFYFESNTDMDIFIKVFLDGIEIEELRVTID